MRTTSRLSHRSSAADRQVVYGSFTRDLCDKYLTILPTSKVARLLRRIAGSCAFLPDAFKRPATSVAFSPSELACRSRIV